MSEKHIEVIADYNINPLFIENAKQALLHLIPLARNEPGCWHYDLFQNAEKLNQFTMIERWANKASWEAHLQQEYVKNTLSILEAYLESPIKLRRFDTVD